ncbi:Protein polybromo-1 [Oleoguttula sp. CCFEE 5521]
MALTLREQYIKLQRDRETAAAELQRQFGEQDAELKRKEAQEAQEAQLRTEGEELETTLSRCDEDEASTMTVLDEALAEFAVVQEQHALLCAKLRHKLDAITTCRGEVEEGLRRFARSIERLYQIEALHKPNQPNQNEPSGAPLGEESPAMPVHQQHFLLRISYKKAPSYREIVTKPMDLATLAANLLHDKYATVDKLRGDFDLIEAAAREYNADNSDIVRAVVRMRVEFLAFITEMPDGESDAEDDVAVADSEHDDEDDVHGLPAQAGAALTTTFTGRDSADISATSHARKVKAAVRRPTTTDQEWPVDPQRWSESSNTRKRTIHQAGLILETDAGELALEVCTTCVARGTVCKVYKDEVRKQRYSTHSTSGYCCGLCYWRGRLCSLQVDADKRNGVKGRKRTKKEPVARTQRPPLRPHSGNGLSAGSVPEKRTRQDTSSALAGADVDEEVEN